MIQDHFDITKGSTFRVVTSILRQVATLAGIIISKASNVRAPQPDVGWQQRAMIKTLEAIIEAIYVGP